MTGNTNLLKRPFDLGLVLILELILVAHHQIGVWHTKLRESEDWVSGSFIIARLSTCLTSEHNTTP